MNNEIDHIDIGTISLDIGVAALEPLLGAAIPRGGKHAAMSTHNCVTRIGDKCFLELLAIDPEAPAPTRRRWFSMDDPATQARIAERPRALCWVVRTTCLDKILAESPVDIGEVVEGSRGGKSWRITVPRDGHLPEKGLLPAFVEWSPGPHPTEAQQDLGIRLQEVRLTHPEPEKLKQTLAALRVDHLATVAAGPAALAFLVDTPRGLVVLD